MRYRKTKTDFIRSLQVGDVLGTEKGSEVLILAKKSKYAILICTLGGKDIDEDRIGIPFRSDYTEDAWYYVEKIA